MRRRIMIGLAVVATVVGLNFALESPAAAASCTVNNVSITLLHPNDTTMRAVGSYQGCYSPTSSVIMSIQRWRGLWWEFLVDTTVYGTGQSYSVLYNCRGTGIHDYRVIAQGYTGNGSVTIVGNQIHGVNCPN